MPIKECTGIESQNDVDKVLDDVIDLISTAKGKGNLTEDKYDEIMEQADSMRTYNNKLKCMLSEIPSESTSPESILNEVESEITPSAE